MENIKNMIVKNSHVALAPNLKAISIACSKDPRRDNLTSVYKDRGVLVATDGSRLNFVKVAENDSTSGYLDGRTGVEFPNWCFVIPETWASETVLNLSKDTIRKLKALEKLAKLDDQSIRITLEEKKTTFELVGTDLSARYEIVPDSTTATGSVVTINLRYFLEFIEAFKASGLTGLRGNTIYVTLRAGETDLSPIMLEVDDHYSIIMPMMGS